MKTRINTNCPRINTNRGQSLAELAVFGTVLLLCFTLLLKFGMSANYGHNIQMQGFRKAFVRAASSDSARSGFRDPGWEYETGTAPLPSNHWRNVSYALIEDKPVFSASEIIGVAERTPVGTSAQAVCSIDLFGQMVYGDERDLPRVEFEINGRRYSFTTAGFKTSSSRSVRRRVDIPGGVVPGPSWRWEIVSAAAVRAGDSVDVDGDGFEEYVLQNIGGSLRVVDYQEGEINLSIPSDDPDRQGLQPDYDKTTLLSGSLTRSESPGGITTSEGLTLAETINRIIRTNSGDYEVSDELVTERAGSWSVSH